MLLGATLARSKEEAKELLAKDKEEFKAREQEHKQLNEKIILLKAKLIQMRDIAALNDVGIKAE